MLLARELSQRARKEGLTGGNSIGFREEPNKRIEAGELTTTEA